MLSSFSVFGCFWLLVRTTTASDLFSTLRSSNATLFANLIEANPSLCALYLSADVKTIFAPVDAVLTNITHSRRAWPIRRNSGDQDLYRRAAMEAANEVSDIITNESLSETLSKRATLSLPFLFTTASADVPANLEGRRRQKYTMIDGGSPLRGNGSGHPQIKIPALQLVTGLGNKVTVVKPGIKYDGGSIFTIDGLFTIPTKLSNTLATLSDTTSFGALLNSRNLTASLDTQRGGTFFIPSNAALAARAGNGSLSNNAIYSHVVQGFSAYLPLLEELQTLKTANGGELTVRKSTDGEYYINGAKIISTNIILENGVAYVIDKVLASPSIPTPPINNAASSLWSSTGIFAAFTLSAVFAAALLA